MLDADEQVKDVLDKDPPQVEELRQPLWPSMRCSRFRSWIPGFLTAEEVIIEVIVVYAVVVSAHGALHCLHISANQTNSTPPETTLVQAM